MNDVAATVRTGQFEYNGPEDPASERDDCKVTGLVQEAHELVEPEHHSQRQPCAPMQALKRLSSVVCVPPRSGL